MRCNSVIMSEEKKKKKDKELCTKAACTMKKKR